MTPPIRVSGHYGLAILLNFAVLTAFIAVVLTVVRHRRLDAVPILLGALGFEVPLTGAAFASSFVLSRFMPGGVEGFARARGVNRLVLVVRHASARCLCTGVNLQLARPREHA